jgi:acetoin utilization protein AcuC
MFVYKGDALANYGFGDEHPFGVDRHDAFQTELANAQLGTAIQYADPRRASVDELALFHTPEYIDRVSKLSQEGRGFLDDGDTPAYPGIFGTASDVVGATLAAIDAIIASCRSGLRSGILRV